MRDVARNGFIKDVWTLQDAEKGQVRGGCGRCGAEVGEGAGGRAGLGGGGAIGGGAGMGEVDDPRREVFLISQVCMHVADVPGQSASLSGACVVVHRVLMG